MARLEKYECWDLSRDVLLASRVYSDRLSIRDEDGLRRASGDAKGTDKKITDSARA